VVETFTRPKHSGRLGRASIGAPGVPRLTAAPLVWIGTNRTLWAFAPDPEVHYPLTAWHVRDGSPHSRALHSFCHSRIANHRLFTEIGLCCRLWSKRRPCVALRHSFRYGSAALRLVGISIRGENFRPTPGSLQNSCSKCHPFSIRVASCRWRQQLPKTGSWRNIAR
jgi:hypothetical protein